MKEVRAIKVIRKFYSDMGEDVTVQVKEQLENGLVTNPPAGAKRVSNIYVEIGEDGKPKLKIEYDDA